MSATRRLLIAALGGEGGGVLMGWIMRAAEAAGVPAQATSVPGVAQRTGATTYYIEMAAEAPVPSEPVFALMPVAGDVDIVLASELLEAARMVERGFVTPDRTILLSSTHRVLTTREKMARGDGRLDAADLMRRVEAASRERFLFDAECAARSAQAPLNAVLLGALAGRALLPIAPGRFRAAIEAGGIAVEANLRGFDAGLALAGGASQPAGDAPAQAAAPGAAGSLDGRLERLPAAAREVARLGVARLTGYQDADYAGLYLDRLAGFEDDPALLRAVARHLAVRMSFEDVIRVAQLKVRAGRFERIRDELGVAADEPYEVVDFFKPGLRELADLLPSAPGRRLLAWAGQRGVIDKWHLGLRVKTTTVTGFLRVWLLARLRPWRRRTLRFAEEQRAIEDWLALVQEARAVSPGFALAAAEMARLVKGYGEIYRSGQAAYGALRDDIVTPALRASEASGDPEGRLRAAIEEALAAP